VTIPRTSTQACRQGDNNEFHPTGHHTQAGAIAVARTKRRVSRKNIRRKREESEISSILPLLEKPTLKNVKAWASSQLFKKSNTNTTRLDESQANMILSVVNIVKTIKDFTPGDMSQWITRAGLCVLDNDYDNYAVVMKKIRDRQQKSQLNTRMLTDGKIGSPEMLTKTNDNNIPNRVVDARPQF